MSRANVGDVVILTGEYERPSTGVSLKNKTGVVIVADKNGRFGVEFDLPFAGGHNLNNTIATMRGWYCPMDSVTKMEPVANVIKNLYFMD